jgi:hypothetical protein
MKLNQKIIDAASNLMETLAKRCHWYHDTPEQPFEYTAGSIWLINPETEEWMLELKKSGTLYYYIETTDTFSKYLNMGLSDFESFIKIWVEHVLKKGVVSTRVVLGNNSARVEHVLKKGVVSTFWSTTSRNSRVEDALKNGKQWN